MQNLKLQMVLLLHSRPPLQRVKPVYMVRTFDFEVIVSVNEQNKLEVGEGGVMSYISAQKGSEKSNNNVNKVCFSIPFVPEAILSAKKNNNQVT